MHSRHPHLQTRDQLVENSDSVPTNNLGKHRAIIETGLRSLYHTWNHCSLRFSLLENLEYTIDMGSLRGRHLHIR